MCVCVQVLQSVDDYGVITGGEDGSLILWKVHDHFTNGNGSSHTHTHIRMVIMRGNCVIERCKHIY